MVHWMRQNVCGKMVPGPKIESVEYKETSGLVKYKLKSG